MEMAVPPSVVPPCLWPVSTHSEHLIPGVRRTDPYLCTFPLMTSNVFPIVSLWQRSTSTETVEPNLEKNTVINMHMHKEVKITT